MSTVISKIFSSRLASRVLPLALIWSLLAFFALFSIESTCSVEYSQYRATGLYVIVPEPACLSEWIMMTTAEERDYQFPRRMDAMNFYLRVLSRFYGFEPVLLPEPKV